MHRRAVQRVAGAFYLSGRPQDDLQRRANPNPVFGPEGPIERAVGELTVGAVMQRCVEQHRGSAAKMPHIRARRVAGESTDFAASVDSGVAKDSPATRLITGRCGSLTHLGRR